MERVGVYWHMLPTLAQGKKVVWNGITKDGRKVLDAWPEELIVSRRNDDMSLTLKNGSLWQVVGSDNYDSLVGANPVGVVFSEYSIADPAAWDFIRPILRENGGWALFIYTPRGKNHGYDRFRRAQKSDNWFAETLGVNDTDVVTEDAIQEDRDDGMEEAMIQQEYYCSWDAPLVGAFYGKQMLDAEKEKRIREVRYDYLVPVETWWDLGIGDSTAIWFVQRVNQEIRLIDYYETNGEGLQHYAKLVKDKPYVYSHHIFPHDVAARELTSGKSREEVLRELGISVTIAPKLSVDDGIQAVRAALPNCWFDADKCERGIEALRQYHKVYDDKNHIWRVKPVHDWASHGADSFRYGVLSRPKVSKWQKLEYDNRGIV